MKTLTGIVVAAALLAGSGSAHAAVVAWTDWNPTFQKSATTGSATGLAGTVGVTYTGELENLFFGYPSWQPASTFSGGPVSNPPPSADGIIQLFGDTGSTNTISFSQSVFDPVIAIWSLGQSGGPASLVFTHAFTITSGGKSFEYQGSSITTPDGLTAAGVEGNGVVRFNGKVDSISFTNPQFENWYGFTVGTGAVPEPASWALMITGFGLAGGAICSRRRMASACA